MGSSRAFGSGCFCVGYLPCPDPPHEYLSPRRLSDLRRRDHKRTLGLGGTRFPHGARGLADAQKHARVVFDLHTPIQADVFGARLAWKPWIVLASRMRWHPASVRGPVAVPPCIRRRPLAMAGIGRASPSACGRRLCSGARRWVAARMAVAQGAGAFVQFLFLFDAAGVRQEPCARQAALCARWGTPHPADRRIG